MVGTCELCSTTETELCRYCGSAVCAEHERPSAHRCTGPRTAPSSDRSPVTATPDANDPIRTAALVLIATVVVAMAIISGVSLLPVADTPAGPNETKVARLVHQFVNEERQERGLHALAWNETLARVARDHSERMAREDYFSHGPEPLFERYERYGLGCPGGENIYATPTVGAVNEWTLARRTVDAWLTSSGHRESLLKKRFTVEGVGVTVEREASQVTVYVTENFC